MRRLLGGILAALVALVAFAVPAAAHETEEPYLYLNVAPDQLDGRVELAIGDVDDVLGIDTSGTDVEIEANLRAGAAVLQAYVADHFSIGTSGDAWDLEFGRVDLFRERAGALAFAVVQYEVRVPDGEVPRQVDVRFDPFFEEIPDRSGLVLVAGGWGDDDVYDRDVEQLVTYSGDETAQSIDFDGQSNWDNFRSGISLGIDHIKTGPDHILFVLALLLPSVLVFSSGWKPVDGFGRSLWRVLKIATFFTIAHSVTFTLAGMEWLPLPPSKLVEAIIAASIAFAALHNLRPIFPNREWALAFVFGLFHGMGFASLVANLQVSKTSQLVSLLGRNVGIEIGQVAVILLLFPALFLLRRTDAYQPVLTISSIVLAVLATGWMIERLFETDLGTDGIVDVVASTPNGYLVALAATLIAAAVHLRSRRNQTLLPVASIGAPDA